MGNLSAEFSRVAVGLAMEDPDLEDLFRLRIGCGYEISGIDPARAARLKSYDQAAVRQKLSEGYRLTRRDTALAVAQCLINVADRTDLKLGFDE